MGSYDPVTWALLLDALNHPGPAGPARVGLTPCTERFMPGVNPATFAMNAFDAAVDVETSPAQSLTAEGPLACYTTTSCVAVAPACARVRIVRIALRAIRGSRIVAVTVRRGRRIVARAHGRTLRSVTGSHPRARSDTSDRHSEPPRGSAHDAAAIPSRLSPDASLIGRSRCSAGLAELARELRRCEDGEVVAEDEQVLIARDQVRAAVDCEGEEVVVVRVSGADWRRAGWILGDRSMVTDPVGEAGRFLGGDPLA